MQVLLGVWTLLGAPGLTTRSKKLLGAPALLLVTRTLLGAKDASTTSLAQSDGGDADFQARVQHLEPSEIRPLTSSLASLPGQGYDRVRVGRCKRA